MLVQELFIAAMEVIGATQLDETPEPSELQKCMRHCNLMLNSWSGRRLMVAATIQENFPLVARKRTYTIGIGGDFNTDKPVIIESGFVRDNSGTDYPLTIVETDVYDSYDDKMLSFARPDAAYYSPGATQQATQMGTLFCYPIPDAVYTVFLNMQKYLTQFTSLSDVVTFQPMYYDAIVQNLACKLWRLMGRKGPIPSDILIAAQKTMQIVENINHTLPTCRIDVPGSGTPRGNVMTGDWIS